MPESKYWTPEEAEKGFVSALSEIGKLLNAKYHPKHRSNLRTRVESIRSELNAGGNEGFRRRFFEKLAEFSDSNDKLRAEGRSWWEKGPKDVLYALYEIEPFNASAHASRVRKLPDFAEAFVRTAVEGGKDGSASFYPSDGKDWRVSILHSADGTWNGHLSRYYKNTGNGDEYVITDPTTAIWIVKD